jgi:AcrR family transcriptional regulator
MAAAKAARKVGPRPVKRKIRPHGEASRQRILDAATQIAGERGYDGTSVALVSERSGLPASSIYWHFESKDQLIAAVIERSFDRWLERMHAWVPPREGASQEELFEAAIRRTAAALTAAPDFLRLGLMLVLERRPQEATARRMFLQVRERAYKGMVASYEAFFAEVLDAADVRTLATLTMAAADGLFIAHELEPASVNLADAFQLLAEALLCASKSLSARSDRPKG